MQSWDSLLVKNLDLGQESWWDRISQEGSNVCLYALGSVYRSCDTDYPYPYLDIDTRLALKYV